MARVTVGSISKFERRVLKELPKLVQSGAVNVAIERSEWELARENAQMPETAPLDADTKRQRREEMERGRLTLRMGLDSPLVRTGALRDSGWINVLRRRDRVTYNIRRRGRYQETTASEDAQKAHAERLVRPGRKSGILRAVRFNKDGVRSVSRDAVAGVMRNGEKRRRKTPKRDYTKIPNAEHDRESRRLMRKHLSANLGLKSLRVLKAGSRLVVEIIEAAAEVA